jgi:hypothetical protein
MNSNPEEPMDTKLLQLERELFSLSPVETPRHLAARLDQQVSGPVSLGRQTVVPRAVPFRWRRIVAPAAAAVVVVSVLNRWDSPSSLSPGFGQTNPVTPSPPPALPVADITGYVLRAEPVFVSPAGWQSTEHHYYIQPGGQVFPGGSSNSRRPAGIAPVVFH